MYTFRSSSGFTLIELMIALAIFGMMSVMVMTIYLFTTNTSHKLNAERQIAQTARDIIDHLQNDIRQYGFSGSSGFDPSSSHIPWTGYDYTGSGSEYLNLGNARYVYGYKTPLGLNSCDVDERNDPKQHCGFYIIQYDDNGKNGYNIVDSFVADESQKRVKIDALRFYVSGDGQTTTKKVMLDMSLVLMPQSWVTGDMISQTRLHIQTTLSDRGWKKN